MNIQSDYKHLIKAANLAVSQKWLLLKFGCLLLIASIVGLLFPQLASS